ncbi:MAG: DUF1800 domain-containing protein [Alphaproteobacteria bacterium]|nr:DUF1800 domain-containing protein [Alphaproteobacteria bacterium]
MAGTPTESVPSPSPAAAATQGAGPRPPDSWAEDLAPIGETDWNHARARHLLDRAGFGGTPDEIARLAGMAPAAAVASLVDYHAIDNGHLPPFESSGIYDPTLTPFPPTRPAATRQAAETGMSMGIAVKPAGPRRLQPVADRFFFWLRASALETRRIANWWADRMVATNRPLEEKMALFWHGHFATGSDKVRDYRKMLGQLALFQRLATGNFRDLLVGVAQDPAMLVFLDAGQNVKRAPNENFGREVMELFTMGVGNYTEQDIREGARAFTGWGDDGLAFRVDKAKFDDGEKTFLGRTGRFDGVQILDIILEQEVTATFIAGKLYRFLVREDLSPAFQQRLGALLRQHDYEIAPFLRTIFLSRDFYSAGSVGTHIKGPVELIVSTYRRLGLATLPGVPDFNAASGALGQVLLNPPTVAGWAQGRAWITPGSLLARGNFARDVVQPDMIDFVDPNLLPTVQVRQYNTRILAGMDITTATSDVSRGMDKSMAGPKATANLLSDREDFNTHYASLVGWREAARRVKPILRAPAQFSLTEMVFADEAKTTSDAVDLLMLRFLAVPLDDSARAAVITFLDEQLGTSDLVRARSYLEEPLRVAAHLIMSAPEYQLA